MPSTRRSLLLRLRDVGDDDAWAEFHALYAPLVRRFAARRLTAADRDDVLQDVLLALSQQVATFDYDPQRGTFRGYVRVLTERAIAKKVRQNARAPGNQTSDACSEAAIADADWEQAWRQHHLDRALAFLARRSSERDVTVFRRLAIEGRDAKVTAREFDLSMDQLYQIKSRLLRQLGDRVEAQIRAEDRDA